MGSGRIDFSALPQELERTFRSLKKEMDIKAQIPKQETEVIPDAAAEKVAFKMPNLILGIE